MVGNRLCTVGYTVVDKKVHTFLVCIFLTYFLIFWQQWPVKKSKIAFPLPYSSYLFIWWIYNQANKMFESLVEWKNGTVSTDIHLQAEISGSMPRVVLRESNKNKFITIFCKKSKIRSDSKLSLSQFVYFFREVCLLFNF